MAKPEDVLTAGREYRFEIQCTIVSRRIHLRWWWSSCRGKVAEEYVIFEEPSGKGTTVAQWNREYPSDDDVVCSIYRESVNEHHPEIDDICSAYQAEAFDESRVRVYVFPVSRVTHQPEAGDA